MATNDGHIVYGRKYDGFAGVLVGMSYDFAFDTTNIATGVFIVRLPKGAKLFVNAVGIITAFNAATTNVITLGYGASYNELIASGDVNAGTAGYTDVARGKYLTFTEDKDLFLKYAQTGTAANAGAGRLNLSWICGN